MYSTRISATPSDRRICRECILHKCICLRCICFILHKCICLRCICFRRLQCECIHYTPVWFERNRNECITNKFRGEGVTAALGSTTGEPEQASQTHRRRGRRCVPLSWVHCLVCRHSNRHDPMHTNQMCRTFPCEVSATDEVENMRSADAMRS